MIKAYWTSRDGVLGTAHRNRHGVEVDFRPAKVEVSVDRLTNLADGPSWIFEAIATGPFGPVAPLKIPAEVVSRGPAERGRIPVELRAEYAGAVMTGTGSYYRKTYPEETFAWRAKLEEGWRVQKWIDLLSGRADVLLRLGNLTHRDFGRLGSPRPGRWESRLVMIQDRVRLLLYGEIPDGNPPAEESPLGPERLRNLRDAMLTHAVLAHAAKKRAWRASQDTSTPPAKIARRVRVWRGESYEFPERIELDDASLAEFERAVADPPAPNEALREMFRRARDRSKP